MCVEANAKHHAEYPSMRTCDLVPRCVSSNEGEVVSFHEDPQEELQSGVVDSNYTNPHIRGNVTSMTCTTVANILKERGITHVDYLSLDVEGHELQVLKGIDLNTVRIDVITIEVKPQFLEEVPRFMNESGYYRHPIHASEKTEKYPYLFIEDQLYIRRGVVFGEPQ